MFLKLILSMQLLAYETIEHHALLSRDNACPKSHVLVNELSESFTSASTQEIAGMVADIQKDAAAAAESINSSVASMEATSKDTAQVEHTMHEMIDHVDQVTMQITQIASAAEEQSAATNEISLHIHDISDLAQNANHEAQNSQEIIDKTVVALHSLRDSIAYFHVNRDGANFPVNSGH